MRVQEGAEMGMSIFERFVPKKTAEAEETGKKPPRFDPYKKLRAELDEAANEAKEQYPEDGETVDEFLRTLKRSWETRYKKAAKGELQAIEVWSWFHLSKDRMSAYACIVPPEDGEEGMTLEEFLGNMRYEGIRYGVLRDQIQRELSSGRLRIFPVARGKAPKAAEEGTVTNLFKQIENLRLEARDGERVDFNQNIQFQPIRKGTAICLIRPPKPGTDGMDVTGQELPSPQPASLFIPQGENTAVGKGGQALVALEDGLLYHKDELFCVHAQRIIDGDLDQFQGTLRVSGNLYIEGSVDGGVSIEAKGDILINGKLGQARVISSGTVRVQQGIYGTEGKTFLQAGCQVQARVMEWAEIEAGDSVFAETITNSTIRCGGTVYAASGRGLIVDSQIRAGGSVLCLRVGNLAGGSSQFSVGYPPELTAHWETLKTELEEVQTTLDQLWTFITDLRKKGSRISDKEKEVLDQLVEQRDLYNEKRETLKTEIREVNKELGKRTRGRVECEELYPSLTVQIGRTIETITTEEEACKIHVEESRMYLR